MDDLPGTDVENAINAISGDNISGAAEIIRRAVLVSPTSSAPDFEISIEREIS